MRPDRPAFSIVIPAYNAAPWISFTLDSWAAQTVRDFEVIVVDDGSDDDTAAIAESFARIMSIRVIRERHSGAPAHPCNVGIAAARAELVVHCDADDLATPDRLAHVQEAWERAGQRDCLIVSDFSEIDEGGHEVQARVLPSYPALAGAQRTGLGDGCSLMAAQDAFSALLEGCFIRPCAAATPRRVLQRFGGFNEGLRNAQDYDLYLRIAADLPILFCHQILAKYRKRPGSISSRPPSELAASKLAILTRLRGLPLTVEQQRSVKGTIAANYEALGYEYGSRRELANSIRAYWRAFSSRPHWMPLRGMAASAVKYARPESGDN